jgi:hypothetical protein
MAADLPLRRGTQVTILKVDGTREQAQFVALVADPPRLRLADTDARRWGGGSWTREMPLSEVTALEGPGVPRFRAGNPLVASAVGMIAGGVLGFALAPEPSYGVIFWEPGNPLGGPGLSGRSSKRLQGMVLGMAAGAAVGTVIGFLSAPKTGPDRRWTFTETGEAVPEAAQVPIR